MPHIYCYLQHDYSEQWALACGEILRILTHYNRPIYKTEQQSVEGERSGCDNHTTTSDSNNVPPGQMPLNQDRKPLRLLSPWITDILLAAPLGIRSDYFRWLVVVLHVLLFTSVKVVGLRKLVVNNHGNQILNPYVLG